MATSRVDAVVVGSGPNGLAAAVALAQEGCSVHLLEANAEVGGGTRTHKLTLPGYAHDVCSAIHPMAMVSPWFRKLQLDNDGINWINPRVALAHPLDGGRAVLLERSLAATARGLGPDERHYSDRLSLIVANALPLFGDLLGPLGWPRHLALYARFGWAAMRSAEALAADWFETPPARALFAGCAAHSFLPLDAPLSATIGLSLLVAAHAVGWPFPKGGSFAIATTLAQRLRKLGATIEVNRRISKWEDLPEARVVLFDTTPAAMASVCGTRLSPKYRDQVAKFRRAPGVFKIDWALDGPIPWRARACAQAGTVHLGGSFEEIATSEAQVNRGEHPQRPFVLIAQPSLFDETRAPPGKHTGWAYCHVPNGSTKDMTSVIEEQVERFAPGFRDRILGRHMMNTAALERYNPNYAGGDITGGSNQWTQFFARPRFSLRPYETSNPAIFLCSSSTPPGGGVHGMCGYHAARVVLRRVFEKTIDDTD